MTTCVINLEGESPNIMKADSKEELQNEDYMGKFTKMMKLSISDNKFKFYDILGPLTGFVQLM